MKRRKLNIREIAAVCCMAAVGFVSIPSALAQTKTSDKNITEIRNNVTYSRAMEAVIWGMPAVNYDRMYQAFLQNGGKENQFAYWSRPSDWKNQLMTPNTDAIYFIPFYNTKGGPVVLEIPPAKGGTVVGSIVDCWQKALEDVGPAGADAGKGGKYLLLPPGYKEKIPTGYIALPSDNYTGYALLRSMPVTNNEADVSKAVEYAKGIKLYPLSEPTKQTVFVDVTDKVFDATIPYDMEFFRSLDRMVQSEPWLKPDRIMIDQLKTIGIEKGKTFSPGTETVKILESALKATHQWIDDKYENSEPYFPGKRWFFPVSMELAKAYGEGFSNPDSYPIDARGFTYYWAFSSIKRAGAVHQIYLMQTKDKAGNPLEGSKNYKLTVPAKVPVAQYWSVTAYNRATHALIKDMPYASRSSLTAGLKTNSDGTVDIYFGPKAPAGKESNWIPTKKGERFDLIFRFFGAEKEVISKVWSLNDLEEVK